MHKQTQQWCDANGSSIMENMGCTNMNISIRSLLLRSSKKLKFKLKVGKLKRIQHALQMVLDVLTEQDFQEVFPVLEARQLWTRLLLRRWHPISVCIFLVSVECSPLDASEHFNTSALMQSNECPKRLDSSSLSEPEVKIVYVEIGLQTKI